MSARCPRDLAEKCGRQLTGNAVSSHGGGVLVRVVTSGRVADGGGPPVVRIVGVRASRGTAHHGAVGRLGAGRGRESLGKTGTFRARLEGQNHRGYRPAHAAEYPSGLRGRIANPLFVGSNPTSAL